MIKEIFEHVPFICSSEYIPEKTLVYHRNHPGEILLMLQDIFEDINEGEHSPHLCFTIPMYLAVDKNSLLNSNKFGWV